MKELPPCDHDECGKLKCSMTPTPKAQAEAIARELRSKPKMFDETVTALEKLIAENERLKGECPLTQNHIRLLDLVRYQRSELHQAELITDDEYVDLCNIRHSPERLRSYDQVQSQLTATEARLSEVTSSGWLKHAPNCEQSIATEECACCDCGLTKFLSTLTAEKKEQG